MQYTKAGIPVNVPRGFNPNKHKKTVKVIEKNEPVFVENPFNQFAELTRTVEGLEESIISPVGTKAFRKALKEGFKVVSQWNRPKFAWESEEA